MKDKKVNENEDTINRSQDAIFCTGPFSLKKKEKAITKYINHNLFDKLHTLWF